MKRKLKEIWKNKWLILEGIWFAVLYKRTDVEIIAASRMKICRNCPSQCYTFDEEGCLVQGTQPCCDINRGGCGCSLNFKTHSLSSECPLGHWGAWMTEEQEMKFLEKTNRK